jgi:hypothetical protein
MERAPTAADYAFVEQLCGVVLAPVVWMETHKDDVYVLDTPAGKVMIERREHGADDCGGWLLFFGPRGKTRGIFSDLRRELRKVAAQNPGRRNHPAGIGTNYCGLA